MHLLKMQVYLQRLLTHLQVYLQRLLTHLRDYERRPRLPFLLLTVLQLVLGTVVFAVAISAFLTTPQYRAGGFWAGLCVIGCSLYRLVILGLRMGSNSHTVISHKLKLSFVMIVVNTLCFMVCLCAFITDVIAAYLLQRTQFQHCSYTTDSMLSSCDNADCSGIQFPPNTCYCCHIMENIQSDCDIPLLFGKQYYFSNVDSCMDIAGGLRIKLCILPILHAFNAVLCVIGVCKTSPVMKSVKKLLPLSEDTNKNSTSVEKVEIHKEETGEAKETLNDSIEIKDEQQLLEAEVSDNSEL